MICIQHNLPAGTRAIEASPLDSIGLMLSSAGFEWDAHTRMWIQPDTAYLPADTTAIADVVRLLNKAGFDTTVDIANWIDPAQEAETAAARHVGPTGLDGHYRVTDMRPGDLVRYREQLSTQTKWARVGRINRRTVDVYPHSVQWSRARISPTAVQEIRRTANPMQLATLALHTRIRFSEQVSA
ncbi:hypothetical protein [Streptosporangium sp. CA-115845]|uniref:hypothetical protein n=1 Tax=Streptosporangium sp. CA-115845 TaxID=3240071 RepID=UPI003D93EFBE